MPLPCVKSQKQPPGQLNLGAIQLTPHELACAFVPRACTETTPAVRVAVMKAAVRNFFICAPFTITIYFLCAKSSDRIILVCEQSSSRLLVVLIELRCPKMAHTPRRKIPRGNSHPSLDISLCALWSKGSLITGNFARFRKVRAPAPLRRGMELFWPIIYLP